MLYLPIKQLLPMSCIHEQASHESGSLYQRKTQIQEIKGVQLSLHQKNITMLQQQPYRSQLCPTKQFEEYIQNTNKQVKNRSSSLPLFKNKQKLQSILMQVQKPQLTAKDIWSIQDPIKPHLLSKQKFITLNQDFKFKSIITLNQRKHFLQQVGELVFNNGFPVPISIAHICYFNTILNKIDNLQPQKVVFAIDLSSQSLTFSGKMNGVRTEQKAEYWSMWFQKQVISRKATIISLLAIIGIPMDCDNRMMKKILKVKKELKQKIDKLFANKVAEGQSIPKQDIESQPLTNEQSDQNSEFKPIIYFGQGTNNKISLSQNQQENKLKIQGGYFIIQSFDYNISLEGSPLVNKTLCRKTLREKRLLDPRTREQNQLKMHKQLQIISTIKNKEYLIQYYCQNKAENLEYLLMEQYNSSLQQYIHYFGEALSINHKINIGKQLVQAVINLHDSGVIHRDLKPSNILLKDSKDQRLGYTIKIIDYAESYSDRIKDYGTGYACSHPYSPIECSAQRESQNKEGIQNKEIDYWSVGITLYEVFFIKLPVSFSRPFLTDIKLSWKNELILIINQRQKYGLALVDDIITIICLKMMKMNQKKRMNLQMAKQLLQILDWYTNTLMSLVS